ncbi:MAG: hypothetical protein RRB22_05760, partial [Gammaproteobacteria bacterium]|nr:hypothetical protein [Gammaproteobacteria bacterium]
KTSWVSGLLSYFLTGQQCSSILVLHIQKTIERQEVKMVGALGNNNRNLLKAVLAAGFIALAFGWSSQTYAVDIEATSAAGEDKPKAPNNQDGATGGSSDPATATTPAASEGDKENTAKAASGRGGEGGQGGALTADGVGRRGGDGGGAGLAKATAKSTHTSGDAEATATGGPGGTGGKGGAGRNANGGRGGDGGKGGDAEAAATAVYANSKATGGVGGVGGDGGGYIGKAEKGKPGDGGDGGNANATTTGASSAWSTADGGKGGNAGPGSKPGGAVGGQGGNATAMATATTADRSNASASATGGDGGLGVSQGKAGYAKAVANSQGFDGTSSAFATSGSGWSGNTTTDPFGKPISNASAQATTTDGKSATANADSSRLTLGSAGAKADSSRAKGNTQADATARAGKEFGRARAEATATTGEGTAVATAIGDVNGRGLDNATAKATANGTTDTGKAVAKANAFGSEMNQKVKKASSEATAPTKSPATAFTQAGLGVAMSSLPPFETASVGGFAGGIAMGDPLLSDVESALQGSPNASTLLDELVHANGLGMMNIADLSGSAGMATYSVSSEFLIDASKVRPSSHLKLGLFDFDLNGMFSEVSLAIMLNDANSMHSFYWQAETDTLDTLLDYFSDNVLDLGTFGALSSEDYLIDAMFTLTATTTADPQLANIRSGYVLTTSILEPGTVLLIALGAFGMLMLRYRDRRRLNRAAPAS